MKKFYASRSSLFLIELILSIFFFIFSAAIVLQLFVTSHFISKDTVNMNNSLYHVQNIAEIFLGSNADFTAVTDIYGEHLYAETGLPDNTVCSVTDLTGSDIMLLLFDKNWEFTTQDNEAQYNVLAITSEKTAGPYGKHIILDIYVSEFNETISDLIANKKYSDILNNDSYIHHQQIKKYIQGTSEQ